MPNAPFQTQLTKGNPYVTKGISKSLLTPCRQVGLSRKKKTPNSANNSFSESTKSSVVELSSVTPLNEISNESETKVTKVDSKWTKKRKHKGKNKVSKRLISDDDDSSTDSNANKKLCNEVGLGLTGTEDKTTAFSERSSKSLETENIIQHKTNSTELSSSGIETKSKSKTKSKKSLKKSETILENPGVISFSESTEGGSKLDNICEKAIIKMNEDTREEKSFSEVNVRKQVEIHNDKGKNISIEVKTDDSSCEQIKKHVTLNNAEKLECKSKEVLDNNSEMVTLKDVTNKEEKSSKSPSRNSSADKPKKMMKRSLSMKRSSSDDMTNHKFDNIALKECSTNPSPLDDKFKITDLDLKSLPNEIKNLQKQIKEKQNLVNELKQAEIYKKKQDVKELEKLTAQWKTGCISALNDLLPQLQKHLPVDMATLLNNLGIPKEKITLSSNGDLI